MATFINHDTQTASLGGASLALRGLAERYQRWSARRRQVARTTLELQAYTDRQLADLGLCRSDIAEVARGQFRRA